MQMLQGLDCELNKGSNYANALVVIEKLIIDGREIRNSQGISLLIHSLPNGIITFIYIKTLFTSLIISWKTIASITSIIIDALWAFNLGRLHIDADI